MKLNYLLNSRIKLLVWGILFIYSHHINYAQNSENKGINPEDPLEIFVDSLSTEYKMQEPEKFIKKGGATENSQNYIYLQSYDSISKISNIFIPIRQNPKPGEYRYISFAWIKWGGGQIGLELHTSKGEKKIYYSGSGNNILNGVKVSDETSGHWLKVTQDLWKDFGDFDITGISFVCPNRRDAGFDEIYVGKKIEDFNNAPPILPNEVVPPVELDESNEDLSLTTSEANNDSASSTVDVDWGSQIKAGGWMMYPLYLLGLIAIIITIQRILTSRESKMAPKELRNDVHSLVKNGNVSKAIEVCKQYPSTLSSSLIFILQHKSAGMEIVSQTAGDIASRDIREHLNKIYPLSVISSLSPLLGLLGTIVGMIEAFALVAMYGDEGGAAILSDAISKALITTAAGLIIAAPTVAVYFIIKRRIMSIASVIEREIEIVITELYLKKNK